MICVAHIYTIVTRVTNGVIIRIRLIGIRNGHAIVADAADTIAVRIGVRRVKVAGTQIAGITNAVAVRVELVGVGHIHTVVQTIDDTVTVDVEVSFARALVKAIIDSIAVTVALAA